MQNTAPKPATATLMHAGTNPMQSTGAFLVLLFLFANQARLHDFSHGIPYTALFLAVLASVAVLLAGDLISALRSTSGLLLIAFTIWMVFGLPFSLSPVLALETLTDYWFKSLAAYLLIVGGLLTFDECRKTVYAIAFATGVIVLLIARYGYMHGGRLVVGINTFANSNDLAMYLLIGVPFCVYALSRASTSGKLLWLLILAFVFRAVLNTGSRGALLAMAVAAAYVFVKASHAFRAMVVCVVVAGIVAAPLVVPEHLVKRYATMFSDEQTTSTGEAEKSKDDRIELITKGLRLTASHPVFGVGPGLFPLGAWGTMQAHVSHNTYIQVSSETGIPGLLLYLAALALAFRNAGQTMKKCETNPALADVYRIAFATRVAWILFLVAAFFGSIAYGLPVMVLLSVTEVLRRGAEQEIAAHSQAPRPIPVRPPTPVVARRQLATT